HTEDVGDRGAAGDQIADEADAQIDVGVGARNGGSPRAIDGNAAQLCQAVPQVLGRGDGQRDSARRVADYHVEQAVDVPGSRQLGGGPGGGGDDVLVAIWLEAGHGAAGRLRTAFHDRDGAGRVAWRDDVGAHEEDMRGVVVE